MLETAERRSSGRSAAGASIPSDVEIDGDVGCFVATMRP
jgi:hypothetical protein